MSGGFEKACVTGGAGFIGRVLTRRLLEEGLEVTVIDDLSVGRAEDVPAGARLVKGSILDTARIREAVSGCDVVFHLAARVAVRSSFEFAVEDTSANVVGTASVLRAAAEVGSVRKLISASTMAIYADAPSPAPIAETHPTRPLSPYGISKLAAEQLTLVMGANSGLESVALRLFNVYGPGQALSAYVGVVTIFVNQLLGGEVPTVFGDGEQARDFVHVEDVAAAFLGAMHARVPGAVLNVGSGVARTVNDVLASLNRVLGTSVQPRYAAAVPGELRYSVADISRAAQQIGYRPAHDFSSSIADVVDEIRQGVRVG